MAALTAVAETPDTPYDIAETVLGHIVGGSVERAYRHTDFLEQRRVFMERWAKHASGHNNNILSISMVNHHQLR